MPRLEQRPPSGHRFRVPKTTRKKSGKRLVLRRVPKPQSLLGTLSIVLALVSLFLIGVDALLKLQTGQGAAEAFEYLKTYLVPAEFFVALGGFVCGVFSFGLSRKRQRNATIGLVFNAGILIGWFFLRSYLR